MTGINTWQNMVRPVIWLFVIEDVHASALCEFGMGIFVFSFYILIVCLEVKVHCSFRSITCHLSSVIFLWYVVTCCEDKL